MTHHSDPRMHAYENVRHTTTFSAAENHCAVSFAITQIMTMKWAHQEQHLVQVRRFLARGQEELEIKLTILTCN